jgi:hypothetical protein
MRFPRPPLLLFKIESVRCHELLSEKTNAERYFMLAYPTGCYYSLLLTVPKPLFQVFDTLLWLWV